MAWWQLPRAGKDQLDFQRIFGGYGGSQGGYVVPLYWAAQNDGTFPAMRGHPNRGFLIKAMAKTVPEVDILAVRHFSP
jgi:hypothetical protein